MHLIFNLFSEYNWAAVQDEEEEMVCNWQPLFTANNDRKQKLTEILQKDFMLFVEEFFPNELFEFISDHTNLYAKASIQAMDPLKKAMTLEIWKSGTDPQEIKRYIALITLMGIVRLPKFKDYWSSNPSLSQPFFKGVMPRNRFEMISRFIHFVDNRSLSTSTDRLFKIRSLLDGMLMLWKANHLPKSHLSIDETIIPFKGRLLIKQYMPQKPHRFGVKAYSVCDAETGYVVKWKIYTGKEDNKLLRTESIVLELLSDFGDKGYHVFTDNFFTSIDLLEKLEKKRIPLFVQIERIYPLLIQRA
jgi:hypothetical protein